MNRFFGYISHSFYGQKKPDGKRNRGKGAFPSLRKCISLKVFNAKMRQGDCCKEQQFGNSQNGYDQLEIGGSFYSINVQCGKYPVRKNGNCQYRNLRKKQIEIGPDSKRNGRRSEYKFNILSHTGN